MPDRQKTKPLSKVEDFVIVVEKKSTRPFTCFLHSIFKSTNIKPLYPGEKFLHGHKWKDVILIDKNYFGFHVTTAPLTYETLKDLRLFLKKKNMPDGLVFLEVFQ